MSIGHGWEVHFFSLSFRLTKEISGTLKTGVSFKLGNQKYLISSAAD